MFADVNLAQLDLRASEPSQVSEVADLFTIHIYCRYILIHDRDGLNN